MNARVETLTPPNTPVPIGHYNHVAKMGEHIWIGGTAGVDPATARLAGPDARRAAKAATRASAAIRAREPKK